MQGTGGTEHKTSWEGQAAMRAEHHGDGGEWRLGLGTPTSRSGEHTWVLQEERKRQKVVRNGNSTSHGQENDC